MEAYVSGEWSGAASRAGRNSVCGQDARALKKQGARISASPLRSTTLFTIPYGLGFVPVVTLKNLYVG
jgi:hypothetical protein